ncbi:ECH1 protein, partial [Crypturellus undulatus]|nr:ECH1 protein [Crypturellus undulatus]
RAGAGAPRQAHSYETLQVSAPRQHVLHVELNRPSKRNALNVAAWREILSCFEGIARDPECRAVVLSGAGKLFTAGEGPARGRGGTRGDPGGTRRGDAWPRGAGIDLMSFGQEVMPQGDDMARRAWNLRQTIHDFQESFTVLEKCPKPVIVAVHGACIGAGEQGMAGDAG